MELQQIIEKIQNELSADPEVMVEADTELLMSGILESLATVTLIAWLEDEMKANIDPGLVTLENFETPSAIHRLCESAVAASS